MVCICGNVRCYKCSVVVGGLLLQVFCCGGNVLGATKTVAQGCVGFPPLTMVVFAGFSALTFLGT